MDAQHDGVRGQAAHAALDVRLQYVGPFEGVVLEESVRTHGVGPVPKGWGMLAVGMALKPSSIWIALLLRLLSPKSIVSNSFAAQFTCGFCY